MIRATCLEAEKATTENRDGEVDLPFKSVFLRISLANEGVAHVSYSTDGKKFLSLGDKFVARQGVWIGAKVGLFSLGSAGATRRGYADYDWFRFE